MIDAIIPISEITRGMKSIGSKSLLKINNLTLIEHQINQIRSINKNIRITLITGFDHEKIYKLIKKKYKNVSIIYNTQYEFQNQAANLNLFLKANTDTKNLLIVNSGVLFKQYSIQSSSLNGNSKIFLLDKPKQNFTIGCDDSSDLEYLFFDLPRVWSECIFLNSIAINNIKNFINSTSIDQMFLFEIINGLLSNNILFEKIYLKRNNITKINSNKDIPKIRKFV